MNEIEQFYSHLLSFIGRQYLELIADTILYAAILPDEQWEAWAINLYCALALADILAASSLRWRGMNEKIKLTRGILDQFQQADSMMTLAAREQYRRTFDLQQKQAEAFHALTEENPWMQEHRKITNPFVEARARLIRESEENFLAGNAARLAQQPGAMPLYRLEMHLRDSIGEITQVGEQVQLSNSAMDERFPFAEYNTRDDSRVRPTHARMQGFIALRSWYGWSIIRPRDGFGCRCTTRFYSIRESVDRGWITSGGFARFETRWPNSAAEKNFREKKFPDAGWFGPKFWTFPQRTIPIIQVA